MVDLSKALELSYSYSSKINKSKVNSKGLCGITCRLTYLKQRKQFSTGQFINPTNWNSKQQFVKPLILSKKQ